MDQEWMTPEERERITGFEGYIEHVAQDNKRIDSSDPGPNSWSTIHRSRMRGCLYVALYSWFARKDPEATCKYLRMEASSALILMRELVNEGRHERVAYVDGKFHWLSQRKDGTWAHRARKIQEMLESRIADMSVVEKDPMVDLNRAFVTVYDATGAPEISVPGMESALGAGDPELARQVAEVSGSPCDFMSIEPRAWYVRVLKYSILGDERKATQAFEALESAPKRAPYQDLGRAYYAALVGDRAVVQEAFSAYIAWFRRNRKPKRRTRWNQETQDWEAYQIIPYEFLLSFAGLAFWHFAASKGVVLQVDEPFLPKELLTV